MACELCSQQVANVAGFARKPLVKNASYIIDTIFGRNVGLRRINLQPAPVLIPYGASINAPLFIV